MFRLPFGVAIALTILATPALARDLTFEQRVEAQEAIERVYYAHQIGVTEAFEQAVPRSVLEKKVATYLRQSVALETIWGTPVTREMLRSETERAAATTRMPERLRELYHALGDDAFLVEECLSRATLVERLARGRFASDERIHGAAARRAEALRSELVRYGLSAFERDPRRLEAEVVEDRGEELAEAAGPRQVRMSPKDFLAWRAKLPRERGEIGVVRDERDAFVIGVVLDEREGWARVASFSIPKIDWDSWWAGASRSLDPSAGRAVAEASGALPPPVDSACPPDDSWSNGIPNPESGHTAVWTGSVMIVWAGYSTPYYTVNTGTRYDPATDAWTPTSTTNAPLRRSAHSAVWTGTEMIVWGGILGDDAGYDSSGGRYDPATDTWTATSTVSAPAGRFAHTAVWTGTRMIVWGGRNDTAYLNTGGRYDPATDTWSATTLTAAPAVRGYHTAVWTGSTMVVWGGYRFDTTSHYENTGGRYDPAANTWATTSTTLAPSARLFHTATWTGATMVVWGGSTSSGATNTGGRYNPASNVWSTLSTVSAPAARAQHTAVWTGSRVVVWGGVGTSGDLNTGGRYDPVANSWSSTATTGAPVARERHTAVWTGSRMIVWGGGVPGTLELTLGSGGKYDPVADSWTPTPAATGIEARENHAAVWTGTLMILWGGYDTSTGAILYLNTGGRYDPATNAWTATATSGAPLARAGAAAVWTGSRMVVWGGYSFNGTQTIFNSGGRYDPVANAWTSTTLVGAPAPRAGASAVWGADRMIVWGGSDGTWLNSGGRYDPVGDTWTSTSLVGAPPAPTGLTAVWTGSKMIVWGADSPGGRYDPAADSWAPVSTVGAPSSRSDHSAVWTGDRMIVWGGYSSDEVNSGGRYDPSSDTWLATSTVGAPSARRSHTAIWTGSRMVVWGGYYMDPFTHYFDTGGRYDPSSDTWVATSTFAAASPRRGQSAVWTGEEMIVWGGTAAYSIGTGGEYAISAGPAGSPSLTEGKTGSAANLAWSAASGATGYDVVRGSLNTLRQSGGDFTSSTTACLADDLAATSLDVARVPVPGQGSFYLVRPVGSCGISGTYDEGSTSQQGSRDAEIAASGVACP